MEDFLLTGTFGNDEYEDSQNKSEYNNKTLIDDVY